jgi:site-specific DNA-methyltransferase (adenine-specific)
MESGAVDYFLTDPPYSSGGLHRSDRVQPTTRKYVMTGTQTQRPAFAGDNRDQRSFALWCSLWLSQCFRIGGEGATLAAFADWRQVPTFSDSLQCGGWTWRGMAAWDKTEAARPQKGWIRAQAEYVLFGHIGPFHSTESEKCHPGVFRYPVKAREKFHITGKPLALMRDLVNVRPGVICDPFAGSGSTLIAAAELGRQAIGVELLEGNCEIIAERLESGVLPLSC